MKNYIKTLLLGIVVLSIATGCRTAVTDQGEPCYPIDNETENILIAFAKKSLNPPTTVLSAEDFFNYVKNVHPVVKITYTDDYYGTIEISWTLPSKRVKVIASGDFISSDLQSLFWRVKVSPIYDESDTIYNNIPGKKNTISPTNNSAKYW